MAYASSIKPVESKSGQDVGFALGIVFILTVLFLPLLAIPMGLTSRLGEPTNSWRGRPILYSGSPIISLS